MIIHFMEKKEEKITDKEESINKQTFRGVFNFILDSHLSFFYDNVPENHISCADKTV